MSKLVIIGGGASGLIAALKASEKNEVVILESNDKCGKKLLLTGNGRCNYWNSNLKADYYNTDNPQLLDMILIKQSNVLAFLENIGIYSKVKDGLYYPYSGSAHSVRELLVNAINLNNNIEVIYNYKVEQIKKVNDIFEIYAQNDCIKADKLIIATGSKAYPKTGSDGRGYGFAQLFGHQINPVLPALASLISDDKYLKDCDGVRAYAKVSLLIDEAFMKNEIGELQFTKNGLSGICVFNLSSLAAKALYQNKRVSIKVDLLPEVDDIEQFMINRSNKMGNPTLESLLESILHYKLIRVILDKLNVLPNVRWHDLSIDQKQKLILLIKELEFKISAINQFENAQVCTGGVSMKEITESMESKLVDDLYFVGEVLDVDGICGGYNLAFAWISGYIAGESV